MSEYASKSTCMRGADVTRPPPLPSRDRFCEKAIRAEYITRSCAAWPAAVWRQLYTTNFCRAIGPRSSVYTTLYSSYYSCRSYITLYSISKLIRNIKNDIITIVCHDWGAPIILYNIICRGKRREVNRF